MGMDVFGLKPKSTFGEYFRNNVWYWHPLWDYCEFIKPDICAKVEEAHSNSGDGLNSTDSRQLAFALEESLKNGVAEEYVRLFQEKKETLEKIDCYCVQWPNNSEVDKTCGTCGGTQLMVPLESFYNIDIENIKEFTNFLLDCGGFAIH